MYWRSDHRCDPYRDDVFEYRPAGAPTSPFGSLYHGANIADAGMIDNRRCGDALPGGAYAFVIPGIVATTPRCCAIFPGDRQLLQAGWRGTGSVRAIR